MRSLSSNIGDPEPMHTAHLWDPAPPSRIEVTSSTKGLSSLSFLLVASMRIGSTGYTPRDGDMAVHARCSTTEHSAPCRQMADSKSLNIGT
jgi:hypothetical protein